jgi:hypothetical protein
MAARQQDQQSRCDARVRENGFFHSTVRSNARAPTGSTDHVVKAKTWRTPSLHRHLLRGPRQDRRCKPGPTTGAQTGSAVRARDFADRRLARPLHSNRSRPRCEPRQPKSQHGPGRTKTGEDGRCFSCRSRLDASGPPPSGVIGRCHCRVSKPRLRVRLHFCRPDSIMVH